MRIHIRNVFTWIIVCLFLSLELSTAIIDSDTPFGPNVRVNDLVQIPGSANQGGSSIAVNGADNIYITWYDSRNGEYDIYFTYSTDGGNTFSTGKRINDDTFDFLPL